jgi:hypothetical protein
MTNKMKNMFLLLLTAVLFCSCDKGEGHRTFQYAFTYSSYDISFDKDGGDTTIYAIRDNWSFWAYIKIDDTLLAMPHCKEVFWDGGSRPGTCSDDFFTVEYDLRQKYMEPVLVESNWFKVTKSTLKEVNISVFPNLTEQSRIIELYPDHTGVPLKISQSTD